MSKNIIYTSQSRLDFDINRLVAMGIRRAFVAPYAKNNQCLADPNVILSNLDVLAEKARAAAEKGLDVYPFFVTINHPEGNIQVPSRYRMQRNIDGSPRQASICFRDEVRQAEMIELVRRAAQLGFAQMAFDDDLRDAFCYCDEHLNGFEGFQGKNRDEIGQILNTVITRPEYEQLRHEWYHYKYEGLIDFARKVEQAVHAINPKCRIGLCNSAKRCHDFSGRDPVDWLNLFSTRQATAFVRLCGECYDDHIMHLAQSTGWHQYFDRVYPRDVERMLEITSVPAIGYRSPGTVLCETQAVIAATGIHTVHWAWTEEFDGTGLGDMIRPAQKTFLQIKDHVRHPPVSPLAIYIGRQLGAYTPINISTPYGATHDPMTAYNILSLVGLPVIVTLDIPKDQPAVMCSAYISRDMIEAIDAYLASGGIVILDATAGRCYQAYGGRSRFDINGPVSLHRCEITPDGTQYNAVADCPPDAVYLVESKAAEANWTGYDIAGNMTGATLAVMPAGKGKLVIWGYDLSRTGSVLIQPKWREQLISMLKSMGIQFPVYWSGPAAVQCFDYGEKVGLMNYNTNEVAGDLTTKDKTIKNITVPPMSYTFYSL